MNCSRRAKNKFLLYAAWLLRRTAVKVAVVTCVVSCLYSFACHTEALADSPSVIDFGQAEAEQAWVGDSGPHSTQAAFVTMYPDGKVAIDISQVQDDTLNAFSGEHSLWRLDHGLMWFVGMPVYVKEIGQPYGAFGQFSV